MPCTLVVIALHARLNDGVAPGDDLRPLFPIGEEGKKGILGSGERPSTALPSAGSSAQDAAHHSPDPRLSLSLLAGRGAHEAWVVSHKVWSLVVPVTPREGGDKAGAEWLDKAGCHCGEMVCADLP